MPGGTGNFSAFSPNQWGANADRDVFLTAIYALGPGIAIDGEFGYTWLDTDPAEDIFFEGNSADHYDTFEIGVGTTLTF